MIDFNFKNKKVNFHKLGLFAKKANLDLKECLNEAFNQNALIDDNIDFLKRFIVCFIFNLLIAPAAFL